MRIIGIRHQERKPVEPQDSGKAFGFELNPTQVAIQSGKKVTSFNLPDVTSELDFVRGKFPTKYRKPDETDDLTKVATHHIKWKKLDKDDDSGQVPANLLKQKGKTWYRASAVPESYDGLKPGDKVLMMFGGSGDELAYALSNQGQKIGATVARIPSFTLKDYRTQLGTTKDDDSALLVSLYHERPEQFRDISPRDLKMIELRLVYRNWKDAQKDRIACELRLIKRERTNAYLLDPELYPEGSIEDEYDKIKASDSIFQSLVNEEEKREAELTELVTNFEVYRKVFGVVQGVGPLIAARIMVGVGDVRRFETEHKFKAWCGVHERNGGKWGDNLPTELQFPRRRSGASLGKHGLSRELKEALAIANWQDVARDGFYQFSAQCNYNPDSLWGKKLRENKAKLRAKHPEKVGKRYSDGHIHKMALWRTITQFAVKLYREWRHFEEPQKHVRVATAKYVQPTLPERGRDVVIDGMSEPL